MPEWTKKKTYYYGGFTGEDIELANPFYTPEIRWHTAQSLYEAVLRARDLLMRNKEDYEQVYIQTKPVYNFTSYSMRLPTYVVGTVQKWGNYEFEYFTGRRYDDTKSKTYVIKGKNIIEQK